MGMFEEFRDGDANTYYGTKRTAVTIDKSLVFIFFFSVVIATALLILVIGSRGKERWTALLRLLFSLHTCVAILMSLFGHGWQSGSVRSVCAYLNTDSHPIQINAHVGLHMGLKSFNVTLTGEVGHVVHVGEVDYNEHFSIDQVTSSKKVYEASLERGLPWPILNVADYLSEDRGGLRWMRSYHEGGEFAFIVLWSALVFWAVGNILIGFVVSRGAMFVTCSGLMVLCACVIYASVRPPHHLSIPFDEHSLTLSYGWCFWLCIVSGILTTLSGLAVLVALFVNYKATISFFLIEPSVFVDDAIDIDARLRRDDTPLQILSKFEERRQSLRPPSYTNPDYKLGSMPRAHSFAFDFDNSRQKIAGVGNSEFTTSHRKFAGANSETSFSKTSINKDSNRSHGYHDDHGITITTSRDVINEEEEDTSYINEGYDVSDVILEETSKLDAFLLADHSSPNNQKGDVKVASTSSNNRHRSMTSSKAADLSQIKRGQSSGHHDDKTLAENNVFEYENEVEQLYKPQIVKLKI